MEYKTYEVKVYSNGTKHWYQDEKLHREDGPAVEWNNGSKHWYRDGKFHRENGPAIEWSNGDKEWYRDGKLHREDGPAIEYSNGTKKWYRDGVELSEVEFLGRTSRVRELTVAEVEELLGYSVKIVRHDGI